MKTLLLLTLLLPGPALAQSLNLQSLEKFAGKASDSVDVTLDGSLLQLAARFLSSEKSDEAQVKRVVAGLTGVYVKSFEFAKPGEFADSDLAGIRSQLKAPGWSRVLGVKSGKDRENAEIYLRLGSGDQIGGLAIIATEPKQLTVVQILGSIKVDDLKTLSGQFGIPSVEIKKEAK